MNSRWRAPLSSLVVLVALAAASPAPGDDEHLRIPSETTVTYVGSNYWLRAKLPENWAYGRSPLEDGLQLAISRDPETGGISSDLITFTEKQALDDWPAHHEAPISVNLRTTISEPL